MRIVIAISLLLWQSAPASRAVIQGRIVRLGTGDPVVQARVVVAKVGGPLSDYRTGATDEAGRFAFRDLTPGSYRIFADRTGYLQAEYGKSAGLNSGTPVTASDGKPPEDIRITMTPMGVIAGRVRSPDNRAIRNVWVRALKASYQAGQRTFEIAGFGQSNDMGEYRIFGLPPGLYFLSAELDRPHLAGSTYVAPAIPLQISDGDRGYRFETRQPGATALAAGIVDPIAFTSDVYLTVYYPGTRDAREAMPVDLPPGAILTGTDLTMSPTTTVHIRGKVIDESTGQLLPNNNVFINSPEVPNSRTDAAGFFDVAGVPSGSYDVFSSLGRTTLGKTRVEVRDRDVDNVTISLRPLLTLTGRLTIEGRQPPPGESGFSLQILNNREGAPCCSAVAVQPNGNFSFQNVSPSDYRFRVWTPGGGDAYIKSIRFGSTNVSNGYFRVESDFRGQQLEIVVSLNTGVLDAFVVDNNRQPQRGVPVVAVPDAARRNSFEFYPMGVTDATGRAHIEGVFPGEYKLFASREVERDEWQDPDVIRIYESRGESVRIREGGKQDVTLRLMPPRY